MSIGKTDAELASGWRAAGALADGGEGFAPFEVFGFAILEMVMHGAGHSQRDVCSITVIVRN